MTSQHSNKDSNKDLLKLIIVGGGAAGLELVTKLGKKLGEKNKLAITLIDSTRTHLWKPLLHQVAAGSLNSYGDELGYLSHAHWNHFTFRLGQVDKIDRENKQVITRATLDGDGVEYTPCRKFAYDTLVIAVGSETNDYGITGVDEHCYFLDSRKQADQFHQGLLKRIYTAHSQETPLREGQLHIAIAGATGVELAAELHDFLTELTAYGLDQVDAEKDISIHIVEAADTILPGLPERLSKQTAKVLEKLNIKLSLGERINVATKDGFKTESGRFIPAEIKVWVAGIKAPGFLKQISGLESNWMG